jgi:cation:H+ antiporter
MVFQGTLLPGIGIMLTPWEPRIEVLTGVLITLAAAAWLRFNAKDNGVVLWALLGNGVLYAAYLVLTLGR